MNFHFDLHFYNIPCKDRGFFLFYHLVSYYTFHYFASDVRAAYCLSIVVINRSVREKTSSTIEKLPSFPKRKFSKAPEEGLMFLPLPVWSWSAD